MRSIFGIIGRSPFGPIVQHTEKVHQVVVLLRPLMEAHMDSDTVRVGELEREITELEHQADTIKQEIRDHLPRSLFLPVDRGDLLRFLREQDSIADRVEAVAHLIGMRPLPRPTPPELRARVVAMVEQITRISEAWYGAATELTTLQEASFGGAEAAKVMTMVNEIGRMEWQADELEAETLRTLFTVEEEVGAVSTMIWMRVVETIGRVGDHAENTADLLRLMMAR